MLIAMKRLYQHALLSFCLVLVLSACLHNRNIENTHFKNLITSNGLKLFEMSFPGPKAAPIGRKTTRPAEGWSDNKVISYLDSTLSQNQYCQKGYLILGRYAGETTHKIRGECKELATEADRLKYPNTILIW